MVRKSDFGRTLKRLRRAAKMTQAQVAKKAGVHLISVYRIEAGEMEPRWETAVALIRAVGGNCEDFMPGQ